MWGGCNKTDKNRSEQIQLNFDLHTSGPANYNTEQNKDIILDVLRFVKDTQIFIIN